MLSRIVRFIILGLIQLFYPQIEARGEEHLPDRPTLFVLNHPNGLLDPLVLMQALGRHVSFLAKSTFFVNPIGRVLMQAFGALPVYRQRDVGKPGGPPGGATDANEATFAGCRALLRTGRPIALFPEGTTHSNTMMLPLRTGAARIALSAEAEASWQLNLQIVPVGLWYQKKSQFRSAALVVFGQPFGLADFKSRYLSRRARGGGCADRADRCAARHGGATSRKRRAADRHSLGGGLDRPARAGKPGRATRPHD